MSTHITYSYALQIIKEIDVIPLILRSLPSNSIEKIKQEKCITDVSDNLKVIIISEGQFVEPQFSAFAVCWDKLSVLLQPISIRS